MHAQKEEKYSQKGLRISLLCRDGTDQHTVCRPAQAFKTFLNDASFWNSVLNKQEKSFPFYI